jgi:hypothetical protein
LKRGGNNFCFFSCWHQRLIAKLKRGLDRFGLRSLKSAVDALVIEAGSAEPGVDEPVLEAALVKSTPIKNAPVEPGDAVPEPLQIPVPTP